MNRERTKIESYFDRLWPICRSIAGPEFRQSLDILAELMPTTRLRFKTGEQVFDWKVPQEWSAKEAYLIGPDGKKLADFKENNLHLVTHSMPFQSELSLSELKLHLYSLPDQPEAIPYVTSYYAANWGFCLKHRELETLLEGRYRVVVNTELRDGHVEIGEAVLPGSSQEEILITSYLCHPSLANNELSGPLATAFLFQRVAAWSSRRYTYRFVIGPETIGSICYLSVRGEHFKKMLQAGYVVTCVGDPGNFTYKRSRRDDTLADRAATVVLRDNASHTIIPFTPAGSDERQYCSPGFNLPIGSLMRTMYGKYPEYHTSLDNKSLISFDAMLETVDIYEKVLRSMEENRKWRSTVLYGEPQLGPRGLYPLIGSGESRTEQVLALNWVINLSDGDHDLLEIAQRSGLKIETLITAAKAASAAGLLVPL